MRSFTLKEMVLLVSVACAAVSSARASGDGDTAEMARQLANPVASLISLPFEYNYDEKGEIENKLSQSSLSFQPVLPFSIGKDWLLVTRTNIPMIYQQNLEKDIRRAGVGDIVQRFFFAPDYSIDSWYFGAGPVLLYPTANKEEIGGGKWGAGPTVTGLYQDGPWTSGLLAHQLWSFAGDSGRAAVNETYLQPFLSYITESNMTFTINSESTFDWTNETWLIPLNLQVSQLINTGSTAIQFGIGGRYWGDSPAYGPHGWGARAFVTVPLPD